MCLGIILSFFFLSLRMSVVLEVILQIWGFTLSIWFSVFSDPAQELYPVASLRVKEFPQIMVPFVSIFILYWLF